MKSEQEIEDRIKRLVQMVDPEKLKLLGPEYREAHVLMTYRKARVLAWVLDREDHPLLAEMEARLVQESWRRAATIPPGT